MEATVATPSASPTPSERPTFAQAFAADAAAESHPATPSTDTPTADQSAATTVQPAVETPAEVVATPETQPGEPPKERWSDILKNTREKTRAEAQAEFDRDYGWAKTLPKETIQEWSGIANQMATDPITFLQSLQREIEAHPVYGPQLRSHAARTLASGRSTASSIPDVQVQDEHGNAIGSLREIVAQHARDLIAQEVGPLKQDFQTRQQADATRQRAERAAEAQRQLDTRTDQIYTRAEKSLPHFKEHEQAIGEAMAKLPDDIDPGEAVMTAWWQVVGPKLGAKSNADYLESLQTKAASATVNPATQAASTTKRPTSFHDASLKWN